MMPNNKLISSGDGGRWRGLVLTWPPSTGFLFWFDAGVLIWNIRYHIHACVNNNTQWTTVTNILPWQLIACTCLLVSLILCCLSGRGKAFGRLCGETVWGSGQLLHCVTNKKLFSAVSDSHRTTRWIGCCLFFRGVALTRAHLFYPANQRQVMICQVVKQHTLCDNFRHNVLQAAPLNQLNWRFNSCSCAHFSSNDSGHWAILQI